jgi:hypothetical protein
MIARADLPRSQISILPLRQPISCGCETKPNGPLLPNIPTSSISSAHFTLSMVDARADWIGAPRFAEFDPRRGQHGGAECPDIVNVAVMAGLSVELFYEPSLQRPDFPTRPLIRREILELQ